MKAKAVDIVRYEDDAARACADELAVEEPLEIRIEGESIAVVMRTPGNDQELAAGFLLTESVVGSRREIFDITHCVQDASGAQNNNVIDVALTHPTTFDVRKLSRHVFSSSSCGICGRTTIEAVRQRFAPIENQFRISPAMILQLPVALAEAQAVFKTTGGLHASALFDRAGALVVAYEDVGRHNALDKLIGHALLRDLLPLDQHLLFLSGRVSFEMMQKALAARISAVAAISAPTSLAVEFARENGQVLVGFVRDQRMNIYAGAARLVGES